MVSIAHGGTSIIDHTVLCKLIASHQYFEQTRTLPREEGC
jgi:hypothetical protein